MSVAETRLPLGLLATGTLASAPSSLGLLPGAGPALLASVPLAVTATGAALVFVALALMGRLSARTDDGAPTLLAVASGVLALAGLAGAQRAHGDGRLAAIEAGVGAGLLLGMLAWFAAVSRRARASRAERVARAEAQRRAEPR